MLGKLLNILLDNITDFSKFTKQIVAINGQFSSELKQGNFKNRR